MHECQRAAPARVFCALSGAVRRKSFFYVIRPAGVQAAVAAFQYIYIFHIVSFHIVSISLFLPLALPTAYCDLLLPLTVDILYNIISLQHNMTEQY